MFERFTADARAVVIDAQGIARQAQATAIDVGHVLQAVAAQDGPAAGPGARGLAAVGVTVPELRAALADVGAGDGLDRDALRAVGVDLDAVGAAADRAFGPDALRRAVAGGRMRRPAGHIPFTRDAKKLLELSLREAIHLSDKTIDSGHILRGILRMGDTPTRRALVRVLGAHGADLAALQAALDAGNGRGDGKDGGTGGGMDDSTGPVPVAS